MSKVTSSYLDGIAEGREWLKLYGPEDALGLFENLRETAKMFDASSPVGQMLRGERDFWKCQIRRAG